VISALLFERTVITFLCICSGGDIAYCFGLRLIALLTQIHTEALLLLRVEAIRVPFSNEHR